LVPILVSLTGCADVSPDTVVDSGAATHSGNTQSTSHDAANPQSEGEDDATVATQVSSSGEADASNSTETSDDPDTSVATNPLPSEASVDAGIADIDPTESNCAIGSVGCSEGNAYECQDLYDSVWSPRPDIDCPLWSERACTAAVQALRAEAQPCETNSDCELWGGMESDYACEGSSGTPPISISLLVSDGLREKWHADFRALAAGGCRQQFDLDAAPQEAVCVSGECAYTDYSCFRDPREAGATEAGTPDLAPDASVGDAALSDADTRDAK
jgi:hypothetical protein